jgi:hypothetical protein
MKPTSKISHNCSRRSFTDLPKFLVADFYCVQIVSVSCIISWVHIRRVRWAKSIHNQTIQENDHTTLCHQNSHWAHPALHSRFTAGTRPVNKTFLRNWHPFLRVTEEILTGQTGVSDQTQNILTRLLNSVTPNSAMVAMYIDNYMQLKPERLKKHFIYCITRRRRTGGAAFRLRFL